MNGLVFYFFLNEAPTSLFSHHLASPPGESFDGLTLTAVTQDVSVSDAKGGLIVSKVGEVRIPHEGLTASPVCANDICSLVMIV